MVEQGDELAGSGVTAAELARVFPSTDLAAASDDVADGLHAWAGAVSFPLALFDAARVDFSLRRLVHYTGSDWRHMQPWVLLTNYHRYVDQFVRHGLECLRKGGRFVRLVLPGNVVIDRGMAESEAQALVEGMIWHRYQMPAYHRVAEGGHGITLVNIGVGPSCFLLPRHRPDGGRNQLYIQRLKNKLGNWSNASAEVEYRGALDWMIGEEGGGVRTILEMVGLTRFDCMIGSSALMRQALSQALHHCAHRLVGGQVLVEHALMQNVLADLALESEAALALTLRLAWALDHGEGGRVYGTLPRGLDVAGLLARSAPQLG
ncbi:hypothetical protein GCM10027514_22160 [Azotobacter armeniacus]